MIGHIFTALGQRMCGDEQKPWGFAFLSFGFWIGHPLWSFPLYLAAAFAWRLPSERPLNHMCQKAIIDWPSAILRTICLFPVIALDTYFNPWRFFEVVLFVIIPLVYYFAGKTKLSDPLKLADPIAGFLL